MQSLKKIHAWAQMKVPLFNMPLWQTVWTQIRLLCSGSMLFASICNSSVMIGNYLQQTSSADDIFLGALRVNAWRYFTPRLDVM